MLIHTEDSERESTQLCYMIGSGQNFKIRVKNLGVPPLKRAIQKLFILRCFMTTSWVKREYLRNEMR